VWPGSIDEISTSIEERANTSADGFRESTSGQAVQATPTAARLLAVRVTKSLLVVLFELSEKLSSDIDGLLIITNYTFLALYKYEFIISIN
jgi:hypothetical protein